MAAQPVEWVMVVHYGPEAHRATYGRQVKSNRYTKDYIQLSKKVEFLDAMANLFSVARSATSSVPLIYRWPAGKSSGAFVFKSADRAHLKWETSSGAPQVWKMTPNPSDASPETIPGDPDHLDFAHAESEFKLVALLGAGQPYLMAIKLLDEPRTLHLRAYLKNPSNAYAWADLELVPQEIQNLAAQTSRQRALAWSLFQSGGTAPNSKIENALSQLVASEDRTATIHAFDTDTGHALTNYLRRPGNGLFFDPTQNHDAWLRPAPLATQIAASVDEYLQALEARFPATSEGDAAAEALDADPEEVEAFRDQIERKSYEVADSTATVKTRGSAQKAFAEEVKDNYGYRCAITGIVTRGFLVASHIVPWSKDQTIRLDPSNGICLSLLMDRAFEKGYLLVGDDLTISIDWDRVGEDQVLQGHLAPYEGKRLSVPAKEAPQAEYLQRRRAIVAAAD
jgi:hypothetical protein